jgi:hypothetical protein
MGVPQTTIAFIDEAGSPEIPCLSKPGSQDAVFCVGTCFMRIHYWQELKEIYEQTRDDFNIPLDQELKWKNLVRHTGPAKHLDDARVWTFLETLIGRIDPRKFKAVAVTVYKDDAYNRKGYIREAQDIYNSAVLFALQRLQNDLDDRYGEGANCPALIIADSRERGGQDNRLRSFVDGAITGGGLWVKFDKSIVEGILFQVSHYSVGVQIADLIAGAAFQRDARNDAKYLNLWDRVLRRSPTGSTSGYGYVRWRG